jgi:hypothetical protein
VGLGEKIVICPDCGLKNPGPANEDQSKAPFVCPDCLKKATPRPTEGWPILARWISKDRGRGVFASMDLERGTLIERCWVMPLSEEESLQSINMPIFNRYLFPWVGNKRCIISGEGLLYNLDRVNATGKEPNILCIIRQGLSAIEFRALRNIRSGEELTWDYARAVIRPG